MKVNDYVRTDDGLIGKIVSEPYEYKDSIVHDIDFGDNNIYNEYEMYQNIIKVSPSIIDILEVGDYVNGLKVQEVNNEIKGFGTIVFDKDNSIMEDYIYSIVTKEMFSSVEYRVEND